jgi:hypothetical protein
MVQSEQFLCGPLALSLNAPRGALLDKFVETLGLYDVVWEPPRLAVKIAPLSRAEVLSTLLRQTVVPRDRKIAGEILSTVAAAARRLEGLHVEIGEDAYYDPHGLDPLERALQ